MYSHIEFVVKEGLLYFLKASGRVTRRQLVNRRCYLSLDQLLTDKCLKEQAELVYTSSGQNQHCQSYKLLFLPDLESTSVYTVRLHSSLQRHHIYLPYFPVNSLTNPYTSFGLLALKKCCPP
jgi:hypothetical protein